MVLINMVVELLLFIMHLYGQNESLVPSLDKNLDKISKMIKRKESSILSKTCQSSTKKIKKTNRY
jgi:hypothetical protein